VIRVDSTAKRRLILNPEDSPTNPSRCGRLLFGPNGDVSLGSDSVEVTRLDAQTWQVRSQPAPNNRAFCEADGQLYAMPVSFTIVSSAPLP
jgi:hypothetical protein